LAHYFNIDPSFVRIGFALLTLSTAIFFGVAAYIIMMIVVPEEETKPSVPVTEEESGWVIDPLPLLVALADASSKGTHSAYLAATFHESIAAAAVEVAKRVRGRYGVNVVALGGGVFQNARLLHSIDDRLHEEQFTVLTPRLLGPNDGAISYGQAAVAAAMMNANGIS